MGARGYPIELTPVRAPLPKAMAENAVAALGPKADAARRLVDDGTIPPDVLAAMTLFLLAGQPKRRAEPGSRDATGRTRGVAGGVWVREHFTVHRPVPVDADVEVRGAIQRSFSRGGRPYSITTSETFDVEGRRLVSNCTTGLVRYRRDPGLADGGEGVEEDGIPRPEPDADAAARNPATEILRELQTGAEVRGTPTVVSLEMMRARDGGQSRNPIHTDEDAAREAGLVAPIVGGSHVFSFVQEALLEAWGPESLCHGACFDLRFLSQVRAGSAVEPVARVARVSPEQVVVDLEVGCESRVAMGGRVRIPLPA